MREWRRVPKIGVSTHLRPVGPSVIADLDTLLIALYVELTDRIIPARLGGQRAWAWPAPARSPTPSWSVWPWPRCCCATTTNTTGCGPRPPGSGTCFPGCCRSPPTTVGCGSAAELLEAALRWLADHTPATTELLRLVDGTPVRVRPLADHRHRGRTCPAGPATATTPPTTASTGAVGRETGIRVLTTDSVPSADALPAVVGRPRACPPARPFSH